MSYESDLQRLERDLEAFRTEEREINEDVRELTSKHQEAVRRLQNDFDSEIRENSRLADRVKHKLEDVTREIESVKEKLVREQEDERRQKEKDDEAERKRNEAEDKK